MTLKINEIEKLKDYKFAVHCAGVTLFTPVDCSKIKPVAATWHQQDVKDSVSENVNTCLQPVRQDKAVANSDATNSAVPQKMMF